jgi:chromosome partitioning protein
MRAIVITVANLKGGVGKTTLVGNLVAYFDKELKKRVLAVDLDYQGSLSTMLRAEQLGPLQDRASKVNALLTAGDPIERLWSAIRPLGARLPRSDLSSAFYDLALFEDALLVEWLIQRCNDDVRYRLASVLHHPKVSERYDIVLLDVPPRMTTGTINALCASTHLLVPTIFAPLSAEPVENFLLTAKGLMNHLNPKLQFLGVVETMTPPSNQSVDVRAQGREVILQALQNMNPALSILDCDIPRRAALADGVGYLKNGQEGNDARQAFNGLGDEIMRRIS